MFSFRTVFTFLVIRASYDALKKYIYQLEKQQAGHPVADLESGERTSLLTGATDTDALFVPLLDRELTKIIAFYGHQLKELTEELQDLEKDVELQDEMGLQGEETWGHYEDDDDEEDDESISRSPVGTRRRSDSHQRKRSSSHRAPSMS
jgi:phosphate transporter